MAEVINQSPRPVLAMGGAPAPAPIAGFKTAIDSLLAGKKVRRLEWPDDGTYLLIHDEQLKIYKPVTKTMHPLIISTGDLMGDDWVVVE